MSSGIHIVLLDLGGVLLRLRDPLETFGMDMGHEEFLETWLLSPAVREFECGNLSTEHFASAIVDEFALPYAPSEFVRRFEYWPDALYDGVSALLESIGKYHQLALLSNTNPVHWNREDIAGRLEPVMDKVFLSYQTGNLKPESRAFDDVVHHFGVDTAEILFLDDNPLNIDAARQCGMRSMLTLGFDSLLRNLRQAGVV